MPKSKTVRMILPAVIAIAVISYLGYKKLYDPLPSGRVLVDGIERTFHYHIPHDVTAKPGLIFILHGSTINGNTMRFITGHEFDTLADQSRDMIVVYPDGYKNYWNDCRKMGTYDANTRNLSDVQFLEEIVQNLNQKISLDKTRMFVVGHSNGGHMAFKIAMEKPGLFRAYASISANLPTAENNDCSDAKQPVDLMIINGTGDPINPFEGGDVVLNDGMKRGPVISSDDTIKHWVSVDRCASGRQTNIPITVGEVKTNAIRLDHVCEGGHRISSITIEKGGHNIPNPYFKLWPESTGKMAEGIDVPLLVWNFFREAKAP